MPEDNDIWKRGYDIKAKYDGKDLTVADWMELSDECRDLYNEHNTTFAMHMATMLLDFFMDLSQQKKAAG